MPKRTDLTIDLDVYDSPAQRSARWTTDDADSLERNDYNEKEISGDFQIAANTTYTLPGIGAGQIVTNPTVIFIELLTTQSDSTLQKNVRITLNGGAEEIQLAPQTSANRARFCLECTGITQIDIRNPDTGTLVAKGKFIVVGDPSS